MAVPFYYPMPVRLVAKKRGTRKRPKNQKGSRALGLVHAVPYPHQLPGVSTFPQRSGSLWGVSATPADVSALCGAFHRLPRTFRKFLQRFRKFVRRFESFCRRFVTSWSCSGTLWSVSRLCGAFREFLQRENQRLTKGESTMKDLFNRQYEMLNCLDTSRLPIKTLELPVATRC